MTGAGIDLSAEIEECRRRHALMREADIYPNSVVFDADFGRRFEYYSGFVFQVELPGRSAANLTDNGQAQIGTPSAPLDTQPG